MVVLVQPTLGPRPPAREPKGTKALAAGILTRRSALRSHVPLREFVEEAEGGERTLVVYNRTEPEPVLELLDATFPEESVAVEEARDSSVPDDVVALVADGEVVATSPLSALADQLLYVNSDIFTTGNRGLQGVDLPDVLLELDDVPLTLRGYPESDREKLVLVAVSRLVERYAHETGAGTIRTSFQRLSRLRDEHGTARVYERLAATDLDVHLYGVPDVLPDPDRYTVLHCGHAPEFRQTWFLIFSPPGTRTGTSGDEKRSEPAHGPAALLAIEVRERTWRGIWTFDAERVERLNRYVERTM